MAPVERNSGPLTGAVIIFLLLQLGSGAFFVPTGAVDIVRIVGLLLLVPFAWRNETGSRALDTSHNIFLSRDLALFKRLLLGYFLWVISSTLLHGEIAQFFTHIGGALLLVIVVRALASDGGATVVRVLPLVSGFALALSIVVAVSDPSQGIAQGRLRGLFINANLLGFYAFFTLIIGILLVRRGSFSLALCTLAISVIVWTGSRTSAIATVSAVLLLSALGNRRSRMLLWVLAGVVAVAFAGGIDPSAGALFRSLDTRDGSFEEAVRVASVSPLLGLGVGGEWVEVASSPLRAFVEGGIIGLIGVIVMYVVLLREARRRSMLLFAVCFAAIVSSIGEGWFLSAIGPMMLVFVAAWIGVSSLCETFRERASSVPGASRWFPEG